MTNTALASLLIDTDNACGSLTGDIDDAFAILALVSSKMPIAAICSIFGNTSAKKSLENTKALLSLVQSDLLLVPGSSSPWKKSQALHKLIHEQKQSVRYAALGPLTNLSFLLRDFGAELSNKVSEVVVIGSNSRTKGNFPPVWPHEFNLTKDVSATKTVFRSNLNTTICPLNIVKKLQFNRQDIGNLPTGVVDFFKKHSNRWIVRNLLLKGKSQFPVWDLVAAMYLINPEDFAFKKTNVRCSAIGHLSYGEGSKSVNVLTDFDANKIKQRFFNVVHANLDINREEIITYGSYKPILHSN